LDRAPGTSETAGELRRRGRVEAETHRISEDVTRAAQARRAAERRRQAQLASPPPAPQAAVSPTSSDIATANSAQEITTWDLASAHLPESLAFKRILVPLDGSERAERAIAVAARIAQASRGSVLLVQVVTPPVMGVIGSAPIELSIEASLGAASDYLKQVARREELADVEVHRKALQGISTATALLDAIELYHCDMAVICSHGRSGLTRWALGSIAQKLVREAPIPVLVLRPDGPLLLPAKPGDERTVRALVTLDGSALAEAALLPAARVVAAFTAPGHGELHLLRVVLPADTARETPALPYRDPKVVALEEARTYLHTIGQRFMEGELAKLGLRISWSMREDTDAVPAILDEAEGGDLADATAQATGPYDLMAMATHGWSGLKLWALGSATDRVLQTTRLPLLVVRPREEAE
jgi:nucleotide-binding universal stress UspA family protein